MAEQIYSLIAQAMKKIGAIGKDSAATNYSGKLMYKFRGIDAVYNALNPVMADLGLFIIPEVIEQTREERQSTNGGNLIYSILKVKFTMFAPDGSSVSGITLGEGMDSGDKASNKAMSAAMKYFAFQTFMIPTEDQVDPDAEVHDVKPKAAPQPKIVNNPADVKVQNKLPDSNPVNPVLNYLSNEKAYLAEKLGIKSDKEMNVWFSQKKIALTKAGVVENIPYENMTMEQAKKLIASINATFAGEEK